ncbi:MAG: hypothetical protein WBS21_21955, partial [Candidatus Acidiferrum sp.]
MLTTMAFDRLFLTMLLVPAVRFARVRLIEMQNFLVAACGYGKSLAGQNFDRRTAAPIDGRSDYGRVGMAVIVVFEIFEDVTDVQEGIAIEANVHESGLHARQNASDFSFVDAADERK